jgi:hypothetical protein
MRKLKDLLLAILIAGLVLFLVWKWGHHGPIVGTESGGVAKVEPMTQTTDTASTEAVVMTQTTTTSFVAMSTDTTGTAATQTTTSASAKQHMYQEYTKSTQTKKH